MRYTLTLIIICLCCAYTYTAVMGQMKIGLINFEQKESVVVKNVQADFFKNADLIVEYASKDSEHDLLPKKSLKLRNGGKTVFIFHAMYVPEPEVLGGIINNYYLFVEIAQRSFNINDTFTTKVDSVAALFYYTKYGDVFVTSGVSHHMNGSMIIDRTKGDTLYGYANFEGDICEHSTSVINYHKFVSTQIEFIAIMNMLHKDTTIIADILMFPDLKVEF